jgi:hypothetical protein
MTRSYISRSQGRYTDTPPQTHASTNAEPRVATDAGPAFATSGDHGLVCRRRAVAPGVEVFGAGDRRPALAQAARRSTGRVDAWESERAPAAATRLTCLLLPGSIPYASLATRTDAQGAGGVPRSERTPEEYGFVRRVNPNVGAPTLPGRQLFAAGFPLQPDVDNGRVTENVLWAHFRTRPEHEKSPRFAGFLIAGAGF